MKAKRLSKSQGPSFDIVTTLPETIIENILCLLPIEEAARTTILSREWRHKWTKIPKLVFSQDTVKRPAKRKNIRRKLFNAINQVLLLRQSPIHEFTLSMNLNYNRFEIDRIILHLSRNHTLKKLILDFDFFDESCWETFYYVLPTFFFSLRHLTDLYLEYCEFDDKQPILTGFGSLTNLSLIYVRISGENLLHLLANCPSLKSLCLVILEQDFTGYEKLSFMELFKCLPVIEHLTVCRHVIPSFVPGELPASLIHLKYCSIELMRFHNVCALIFLVVLTKCSPNLEKIKLQIDISDTDSAELEEYSSVFKEYPDVWLEHLNKLKIRNFRNLEPGLEFVMFILARSPNLKKVILLTFAVDKDEELELLKILLRAPRPPHASIVEIVVKKR